MCPLRFILVFFSALLAGYFAWRSLRNSPEIDLAALNDDFSGLDPKTPKSPSLKDDNSKQQRSLTKVVQDGFWVFVDMASGRYLWRNIKELNGGKDGEVKSS